MNRSFAYPAASPPHVDDVDAPPRASSLRRALLATFVTLVVAWAAGFTIYAFAHDRGPHADLARAALRFAGVPEPAAR